MSVLALFVVFVVAVGVALLSGLKKAYALSAASTIIALVASVPAFFMQLSDHQDFGNYAALMVMGWGMMLCWAFLAVIKLVEAAKHAPPKG